MRKSQLNIAPVRPELTIKQVLTLSFDRIPNTESEQSKSFHQNKVNTTRPEASWTVFNQRGFAVRKISKAGVIGIRLPAKQ